MKKEPELLNPDFDEKRGVKNCPNTSKDPAKKLLKELFDAQQKAARKNEGEGTKDVNTHILGIIAGAVLLVMCTDVGSDISLMSGDTLSELIQEKADMTVTKFECPTKYSMAALKYQEGTEVYIECDRNVLVGTEMQIRHARSLMVRNISWLSTPQDIVEPFIGLPSLEALCLDVKGVLEEALDSFNGDFARTLLAGEDHENGTVARLLAPRIYKSERNFSGMYYSNIRFSDDSDAEYRDDWLDLGFGTDIEMRDSIQNAIEKVKQKILPQLLTIHIDCQKLAENS